MKKIKQIAAISGVVVLLGLYVWSFIAALLAKPEANSLFWAAIFCTIFGPIVLYFFLQMIGGREDGITMAELHRQKREQKKANNKKH